MKDGIFRSENEWRLLSREVPGPPVDPDKRTRFMTANGRIVPYREIRFEELPLRQIVLGASAPIDVDEQGLAMLMEDTLGRRLNVKRSPVPVRP
jgi:hypothetical protein